MNNCQVALGTVISLTRNPDGNVVADLRPDQASAALLNPANVTKLAGALPADVVPADQPGCIPGQPIRPPPGAGGDYGTCTGAGVVTPAVGTHVSAVGPYVMDVQNGWAEIEPTWAINVIGPVPGPSAPTTTSPETVLPVVPHPVSPTAPPQPSPSQPNSASTPGQPPPGQPPPGQLPAAGQPPAAPPVCGAGVSDQNPSPGGSETVTVSSNLPRDPVTVTVDYPPPDQPQTYSTTTDGSGSASQQFQVPSDASNQTVQVGVNINNQARCSTEFIPQ